LPFSFFVPSLSLFIYLHVYPLLVEPGYPNHFIDYSMGWGQNINYEEYQEVSEFKYLGSLVTDDNYCGKDVRA
jgi:hypothetical protein